MKRVLPFLALLAVVALPAEGAATFDERLTSDLPASATPVYDVNAAPLSLAPWITEELPEWPSYELVRAKTIITESDLTYLGVFRGPSLDVGGVARYGYSMGAITGRRVDGVIHIFVLGSHLADNPSSVQDPLYELVYPGVGSVVNSSPVATLFASHGDIYGTARKFYCTDHFPSCQGYWTAGLMWDEARQGVWWAAGDEYNTNSNHDRSLGFTVLYPSKTVYGMWRTTEHSNRTRGYLVKLSDGSMAVGSQPHSGNATSPVGPWLAAITPFNPLTLAPDPYDTMTGVGCYGASPDATCTKSVSTTNLIAFDAGTPFPRPAGTHYNILQYTEAAVADGYNCDNGGVGMGYTFTSPGETNFNNGSLRYDSILHMAWVETANKQGLLAIAQITDRAAPGYTYTSNPSYNTDPEMYYSPSISPPDPQFQNCHGHSDLNSGATGPHSSSTTPWFLSFDPASWASTTHPTQTAAWRMDNAVSILPIPLTYSAYIFGGMWFDPVSQLLFVCERFGDRSQPYDPRPLFYVFQVEDAPPATSTRIRVRVQ